MEPGSLVDGRPLGLFCAVQVGTVAGARVDTRTWLFLPEGRISSVYPFGGAFEGWRCSGDTCGAAVFEPGRMTVAWDGGAVSTYAFEVVEVVEGGIALDGTVFGPARPVMAASLVGQWAEPGGNTYVFGADGSFVFGSLGGTFAVDGLALVVTYADGDVRRRTIFAMHDDTPPSLLSIEAEVFTRQ